MRFNHLSNKKDGVILLVASLCLVVSGVAVIVEDRTTLINSLLCLGIGLIIYAQSKFLLYKNAVNWNKWGMTIKVNSFWKFTSIEFPKVISIQFDGQTLSILQRYNDDRSINLHSVNHNDIEKIREIIYKYVDESRITWAETE